MPARLFVLITAIVFACTSALAQENPAVERIPREAHPGIPAGLKLVCHQRPQRPQPTTWPVLKWRGVSYWAYSFIDNRDAMAIVAYNARGEVLRRWDRTGARYLETILVKHGTREVLFLGQGNQYIKMRWDELDLEAAGDPRQKNPVVEHIPSDVPIPAGLKLIYPYLPPFEESRTCPVLKWRGVSYWAYSFIDNRDAMAIVAYNARGEVLRRWDRTGARYLETILVKHGTREVLFLGQGNQYIKMRWDELDLEAAEGK